MDDLLWMIYYRLSRNNIFVLSTRSCKLLLVVYEDTLSGAVGGKRVVKRWEIVVVVVTI